MVIATLQQIINERISFLKEQINPKNKPQVNETFQLQMDALKSVDDTEKVQSIIMQKKPFLKNSKDVHESYMNPRSCLRSLTAWNGYTDK
jgi:hypothetical protein